MSADSLIEARPRVGFWTYRYGFSLVIGGYGFSLGPFVSAYQRGCGAPDDLRPVRFFRNAAYRGFRG